MATRTKNETSPADNYSQAKATGSYSTRNQPERHKRKTDWYYESQVEDVRCVHWPAANKVVNVNAI